MTSAHENSRGGQRWDSDCWTLGALQGVEESLGDKVISGDRNTTARLLAALWVLFLSFLFHPFNTLTFGGVGESSNEVRGREGT